MTTKDTEAHDAARLDESSQADSVPESPEADTLANHRG